ncbi:MAG: restriction endonuclease [Limisphaerales bacterium]
MARTIAQAGFMNWVPLLLDALRALGGQAGAREVCDWIADKVQLPAQEREKRNKHNILRFENQVHWARQYLVWAGLVDNARRGVWTLTPVGAKSHLTEEQARELVRKVIKTRTKKPRAQQEPPQAEEKAAESESQLPGDVAEVEPPELAQDNELLEVLQSLSPEGFERLCKRLLHEYGLEKVVVTGKSHDGGIDGMGLLRLNTFVTMKVLFQCKRVRKGVSRAQVGDFRNAVMGRADKGILLTTGWFSSDAEKEANREGVIPIELVDGERLVELFEAKQLGLRRKEVFEVDHAFFDQFR